MLFQMACSPTSKKLHVLQHSVFRTAAAKYQYWTRAGGLNDFLILLTFLSCRDILTLTFVSENYILYYSNIPVIRLALDCMYYFIYVGRDL